MNPVPKHSELHQFTYYYDRCWVQLILTSYDNINWAWEIKDDSKLVTVERKKRSFDDTLKHALGYMEYHHYKPVLNE